ncbi:BMP family ABC transporter substrate-binding protein [Kosmotoga pacifica]|uniref:Membrane protein n=2 Tax=Kosmotoga pacifica TaxID=1330330 RepID=A0A0G2ZF34_9BACT|nr:BMP family ABC transporter substrate-binding protein [Kosmotoga pacifica]AKI97428.1 membrane protein [Kosmotoga pacifica]
MKRHAILVFVILLVSVLLTAKVLKVAYIYVGPVGDAGWTYAHDLGRQYIEKIFGNAIKTDYIESVSEGAESESVIRSYAQRGYDLIFATSFGYMDSVINVAKKYPKTIFMHCSGYKTAKNVGTYFGRIYEPDFLSGLIAGIMTKSNIVGYVAAYPIPEVVRGINAFALGIKYVNPTAKLHVIWVNSWYDPALEKEAAISLLNIGADVIAQGQDSPAAQQAAEEYGVYSIGYNSDMGNFAPKAYLGAPVWNWGPYYERVIREVMSGTWKSEQYWGGMADGIVDIDISDLVPDTVKKLVSVFKDAIIEGKFHPFSGPIYDQDGNLRIPAGDVASDEELLSMDWFVDNVVGTVPK